MPVHNECKRPIYGTIFIQNDLFQRGLWIFAAAFTVPILKFFPFLAKGLGQKISPVRAVKIHASMKFRSKIVNFEVCETEAARFRWANFCNFWVTNLKLEQQRLWYRISRLYIKAFTEPI